MKRVLLILLPPLIVLAALAAGLKYWAIPAGEAWALRKLKSYSEKNLPVVIEAEAIKFNILKNAASIEKLSITTKDDLKMYTDRAHVESVRVNLDLFQLLTGRVLVSAVLVDSPEARVQLDPILDKPSKPEALPLNQLFEVLEKIPVERIFIHNLNLELQSQKQKSSAHLQGADLLLGNHINSLTARVDVPRLNLVIANQGPLQTRFDVSAVLGRDNLRITRAGARYGESEVIVKGEFDKFSQVALHPRANLEASGDLKFQEIMQQLRPMLPSYKLPAVTGSATVRMDWKINGKDQITGKIDLKTKDVAVDQFTLGNAALQGIFKGDSVIFPEVEINHPAGNARLTNSEIQLQKNFDFKTNIKVSKLDIQKLFLSLNLHEIPVWLTLQGEMPCSGQIKSPIKVTCEGSVSGENLLVTSDFKNPKSVIADIPKMGAKGQTEITEKGVTYKAQVQLGANTGESSGTIDFTKGFNIAYSSPRVDFSSIRNLANLKLKGGGALEGSTKGDSHSAVFDMKLKLQEFSFEDYYLGQLNGNLSYVKGHLLLNDLNGLLPKSSYQGSLDVDLHDSKITGRIKAPTLDLSDLVKVFEAHYLFPLTIKAPGSADIAFNGPLDFWKLSYQLDSRFKGGQFAGESFDELILNAQSTQGNMQLQKAFVRKNAATINATGGISPQQDLNLKVEGRNFRLDESDFISKISTNIFGILNFSSQLHGKVTEPDIALRGSITETVLDEQEVPSSFFDLKIKKTAMEGNANLFGHRIQADWMLPFSNTPLRLRVKTVDWNYASLLSILSGNAAYQNEYDSSLTADVDLQSESGQWRKVTGNVQVKNLFLKRGNLSFRNPDPIMVRVDTGKMRIQNFNLEGPQNSIQIRGQDFTLDNMNVNIVANTELRLFHMFFPFLDDLGGSVQASATISGSLLKPQILGSLTTNNSFVKIKGLPHPIERIQAEVNFSQTKVLINSIKAQMAGGLVSADGNITINEYRNMPTSIRLNLDGVNLNIPDKVRTSGSADLLISGKWFPFLLSGTYRVSSGIFEREFTEGGDATLNTRQSIYLPKILRQSSFESLILDVQILFEKSFLVKNTLVDGSVQGNLQVKGSISNPILLGRLQADKNTKLIFKDKSFEVQTANVVFNNPDEINPDLYVSAQARVNDYDIMILAQGPAKNLKSLRLTSVPPLPEPDIISLLALGVTSSRADFSGTQGREQQVQAGYELGFAIMAQPINKEFQNRLGVNVQLSSSFDSTRNISVPKVTFSRKVSNRVNASASRSLGADTNDVEVKLRYLINNNVSAIGSYESSQTTQGGQGVTNSAREKNFFGLDLEFRREFK